MLESTFFRVLYTSNLQYIITFKKLKECCASLLVATKISNINKLVPWPSWLRHRANNAGISSSILLGTICFYFCF